MQYADKTYACAHLNLVLYAFSPSLITLQGRVLYVAPAVKEHHEVTVTFQLPCLRPLYASKPDHYISHLVGHEGPGSLLAALKVRVKVFHALSREEERLCCRSCCTMQGAAPSQAKHAGLYNA